MLQLDDLSFWILPGNPTPGFNAWEIYNASYRHHKTIWSRTFSKRGEGIYNSYDFFRQTFVFVISRNAEIVAQICGSFLHLPSEIIQDLSYFDNFKGPAQQLLSDAGARSLMTLEFSATNSAYSPRKVNQICFGEIVTFLGSRYGFQMGADALTGLPRRVTGTNDKVVNAGYRRIETCRPRLGLTVDVVLCFPGDLRPPSDPSIQSLIEKLWTTRNDLTGKTKPKPHQSKNLEDLHEPSIFR